MVKLRNDIFNGFQLTDNGGFWDIWVMAWSRLSIGKNGEGLEGYLSSTITNDVGNHDDFIHETYYSVAKGMYPIIRAYPWLFNDNDNKKPHEKELAKNLDLLGIVKTGHSSIFYGVENREDSLVELLIQNRDSDDAQKTIQDFLRFLEYKTKRDLKNKKPNYVVRVPKLVETIEELVGKKLNLLFPEVIEGFSNINKNQNLFNQNARYSRAIVQKNGSPFTFNSRLLQTARDVTKGLTGDLEKSKSIYDWIRSNITYDDEKFQRMKAKKHYTLYRSALQTFEDGKGVCGEQAFLQIIMERLMGGTASYVTISGKEFCRLFPSGDPSLSHACTAHIRPNGEIVLVDTTTDEGFDIKYKKYTLCSDEDTCVGYK